MQGSSQELSHRFPMLHVTGNNDAGSKVVEVTDHEPPLLEQMMLAAAEAKQKQNQEKAVQVHKESKAAFSGAFKKGFLNSGAKSKPKSAQPTNATETKPTMPSTTALTKPQQQPDIPTITSRPAASSHVFAEVQDALTEEQTQLLGQLKTESWLTDDLMQRFAKNPILVAGMQNPHMAAALQEFQASPQQAMMKYRDHEQIRTFLVEFSRLMGEHFEKLGGEQERERRKDKQQVSPALTGPVREVGPLEQKAIETHKHNLEKRVPVVVSRSEQEEQERVQQILSDPELSRTLMDPQVQRMIQECGDPRKFHYHMRNPENAAILNRLMAAGLLQMTR